MMGNVATILKKELKRIFSDWKLAVAVFILPGLTIALVYSIMGGMIDRTGKKTEEHVPAIHVVDMPVGFKETAEAMYGDDVEIIPIGREGQEDAVGMLENGDSDLVIVFQPDFMDRLDTGLPVITEYSNSVEDNSVKAGYMADGILEAMKQSILAQRLGDSDAVKVFETKEEDVAEAGEKAGKAISMLMPMLLTIFLFAGAMQVGIDIIAGEKERGTMATMLLTPAKRGHIAVGKMLSLAIVSLASCISSLAGVLISLPFSKSMFGNAFDIADLSYGATDYLLLVLQMAAMALSFVSVICLMSSLAKNVKEAGSYIAPIYILVMMISMGSMFAGGGASWMYMLPVYGNIANIKDILTYDYSHANGLFAIVAAMALAGAMAYLMVRTFYSERMMKS